MLFRTLKLFIVVLIAGCGGEDISVEDTKWDCEGSTCQVSFVLRNQTSDEIEVNYSIQAHKRIRMVGSDALVNDVIGEVNGMVGLNAKDPREVVQSVEVVGKPTNIVVSAWQKK